MTNDDFCTRIFLVDEKRSRTYNVAWIPGLDAKIILSHIRRILKINKSLNLTFTHKGKDIVFGDVPIHTGETIYAHSHSKTTGLDGEKQNIINNISSNSMPDNLVNTSSNSQPDSLVKTEASAQPNPSPTCEGLSIESNQIVSNKNVDEIKHVVSNGSTFDDKNESAINQNNQDKSYIFTSPGLFQLPELCASHNLEWPDSKPTWLVMLNRVRSMPTNCGKPIRELVRKVLEIALKEDASIGTLRVALSSYVYRGNSAGPSKRLAVGLYDKPNMSGCICWRAGPREYHGHLQSKLQKSKKQNSDNSMPKSKKHNSKKLNGLKPSHKKGDKKKSKSNSSKSNEKNTKAALPKKALRRQNLRKLKTSSFYNSILLSNEYFQEIYSGECPVQLVSEIFSAAKIGLHCRMLTKFPEKANLSDLETPVSKDSIDENALRNSVIDLYESMFTGNVKVIVENSCREKDNYERLRAKNILKVDEPSPNKDVPECNSHFSNIEKPSTIVTVQKDIISDDIKPCTKQIEDLMNIELANESNNLIENKHLIESATMADIVICDSKSPDKILKNASSGVSLTRRVSKRNRKPAQRSEISPNSPTKQRKRARIDRFEKTPLEECHHTNENGYRTVVLLQHGQVIGSATIRLPIITNDVNLSSRPRGSSTDVKLSSRSRGSSETENNRNTETAKVVLLAIHPKSRHRGFGRLLLAILVDALRRMDIHWLMIDWQISEMIENCQSFFSTKQLLFEKGKSFVEAFVNQSGFEMGVSFQRFTLDGFKNLNNQTHHLRNQTLSRNDLGITCRTNRVKKNEMPLAAMEIDNDIDLENEKELGKLKSKTLDKNGLETYCKSKTLDKNGLETYCICQTTIWENVFFVGCEGCDGWYHPKCINLTEKECAELDEKWRCPKCVLAKKLKQRSRKMAKISKCRKPVEIKKSFFVHRIQRQQLSKAVKYIDYAVHKICETYLSHCEAVAWKYNPFPSNINPHYIFSKFTKNFQIGNTSQLSGIKALSTFVVSSQFGMDYSSLESFTDNTIFRTTTKPSKKFSTLELLRQSLVGKDDGNSAAFENGKIVDTMNLLAVDPVDKVKIIPNGGCHICHLRKAQVVNCCSKDCISHSFCENHLEKVWGFTMEQVINDSSLWNQCPVCSYQCPCASCSRKRQRPKKVGKKGTSSSVTKAPKPLKSSKGEVIQKKKKSKENKKNHVIYKRSNKSKPHFLEPIISKVVPVLIPRRLRRPTRSRNQHQRDEISESKQNFSTIYNNNNTIETAVQSVLSSLINSIANTTKEKVRKHMRAMHLSDTSITTLLGLNHNLVKSWLSIAPEEKDADSIETDLIENCGKVLTQWYKRSLLTDVRVTSILPRSGKFQYDISSIGNSMNTKTPFKNSSNSTSEINTDIISRMNDDRDMCISAEEIADSSEEDCSENFGVIDSTYLTPERLLQFKPHRRIADYDQDVKDVPWNTCMRSKVTPSDPQQCIFCCKVTRSTESWELAAAKISELMKQQSINIDQIVEELQQPVEVLWWRRNEQLCFYNIQKWFQRSNCLADLELHFKDHWEGKSSVGNQLKKNSRKNSKKRKQQYAPKTNQYGYIAGATDQSLSLPMIIWYNKNCKKESILATKESTYKECIEGPILGFISTNQNDKNANFLEDKKKTTILEKSSSSNPVSRRKVSNGDITNAVNISRKTQNDSDELKKTTKHVKWVHFECLRYSPRIFLDSSGSWHNVEAEIDRGLSVRCHYCGDLGATLPCEWRKSITSTRELHKTSDQKRRRRQKRGLLTRPCRRVFHYACARKIGWNPPNLFGCCASHCSGDAGTLAAGLEAQKIEKTARNVSNYVIKKCIPSLPDVEEANNNGTSKTKELADIRRSPRKHKGNILGENKVKIKAAKDWVMALESVSSDAHDLFDEGRSKEELEDDGQDSEGCKGYVCLDLLIDRIETLMQGPPISTLNLEMNDSCEEFDPIKFNDWQRDVECLFNYTESLAWFPPSAQAILTAIKMLKRSIIAKPKDIDVDESSKSRRRKPGSGGSNSKQHPGWSLLSEVIGGAKYSSAADLLVCTARLLHAQRHYQAATFELKRLVCEWSSKCEKQWLDAEEVRLQTELILDSLLPWGEQITNLFLEAAALEDKIMSPSTNGPDIEILISKRKAQLATANRMQTRLATMRTAFAAKTAQARRLATKACAEWHQVWEVRNCCLISITRLKQLVADTLAAAINEMVTRLIKAKRENVVISHLSPTPSLINFNGLKDFDNSKCMSAENSLLKYKRLGYQLNDLLRLLSIVQASHGATLLSKKVKDAKNNLEKNLKEILDLEKISTKPRCLSHPGSRDGILRAGDSLRTTTVLYHAGTLRHRLPDRFPETPARVLKSMDAILNLDPLPQYTSSHKSRGVNSSAYPPEEAETFTLRTGQLFVHQYASNRYKSKSKNLLNNVNVTPPPTLISDSGGYNTTDTSKVTRSLRSSSNSSSYSSSSANPENVSRTRSNSDVLDTVSHLTRSQSNSDTVYSESRHIRLRSNSNLSASELKSEVSPHNEKYSSSPEIRPKRSSSIETITEEAEFLHFTEGESKLVLPSPLTILLIHSPIWLGHLRDTASIARRNRSSEPIPLEPLLLPPKGSQNESISTPNTISVDIKPSTDQNLSNSILIKPPIGHIVKDLNLNSIENTDKIQKEDLDSFEAFVMRSTNVFKLWADPIDTKDKARVLMKSNSLPLGSNLVGRFVDIWLWDWSRKLPSNEIKFSPDGIATGVKTSKKRYSQTEKYLSKAVTGMWQIAKVMEFDSVDGRHRFKFLPQTSSDTDYKSLIMNPGVECWLFANDPSNLIMLSKLKTQRNLEFINTSNKNLNDTSNNPMNLDENDTSIDESSIDQIVLNSVDGTRKSSTELTSDGSLNISSSEGYEEDSTSFASSTSKKNKKKTKKEIAEAAALEMLDDPTDTFVSGMSPIAALQAAGIVCQAVDLVMSGKSNNVFCCIRPPGHHAGMDGCTQLCTSHGFCLLNNVALGITHSRIRWGITKVAVVDIDVHFGNGTAEILKHDKNAFFSSIHMCNEPDAPFEFFPYDVKDERKQSYVTIRILPPKDVQKSNLESNQTLIPSSLQSPWNSRGFRSSISKAISPSSSRSKKSGRKSSFGSVQNATKLSTVPVQNAKKQNSGMNIDDCCDPDGSSGEESKELRGRLGWRRAVEKQLIPALLDFDPEVIFISAGFDAHTKDPLGGQLGLREHDIAWVTRQVLQVAERPGAACNGRLISCLEGGYNTDGKRSALSRCVVAHVTSLRKPDNVFGLAEI